MHDDGDGDGDDDGDDDAAPLTYRGNVISHDPQVSYHLSGSRTDRDSML